MTTYQDRAGAVGTDADTEIAGLNATVDDLNAHVADLEAQLAARAPSTPPRAVSKNPMGLYVGSGGDVRPHEAGFTWGQFNSYQSLRAGGKIPQTSLDTAAGGKRRMVLVVQSKAFGPTGPGTPSMGTDWVITTGAGRGSYWSYPLITSGALDPTIKALAATLKSLDYRLTVCFQGETDTCHQQTGPNGAAQDPVSGANAKPPRAANSWETLDLAYKAANNHFFDVLAAEGVTNVDRGWLQGGWCDSDDPYSRTWPGAAYVDVVLFDPYDLNKKNTTALASWDRHRWESRYRSGKFGDGTDRPLGIGETGRPIDPATVAWINSIPAAYAALKLDAGIVWFDSSQCVFDAAGEAAYQAVAKAMNTG